MFRNFQMVSKVVFGRGCFQQLDGILAERRQNASSAMVFLVDDVFEATEFAGRLPVREPDYLLWVNVDDEPKTTYVDALTRQVQQTSDALPAGVIGIGAG